MRKITTTLIIICFLISCKKTQFEEKSQDAINSTAFDNLSGRLNEGTTECEDCTALTTSYADTIDHPTVLGATISNPYTLPNMAHAYYNVYGHNPSPALAVTHLYVKFSPSNLTQIAILEDEDIDLTDFPLDRETIFEGDYYLQPGKAIEDMPDLWAVVPIGYQFPAGIPHTIITEMFIPDNTPILEDEALYISGNLGADSISYKASRANRGGIDDVYVDPQCPCFDLTQPCPVWPNCGYSGGNGGTSNTNCKNYPKGKISVQNNLATDFSYRGVRNVRVVIRRTFKKEQVNTDNFGNFASTKYFKNKYRVLVKFKNSLARISRSGNGALAQRIYPIKINFGLWSNLPCNYEFKIDNPTETGTIQTSQWAAATANNAIFEHREMCIDEGVGLPPKNLNILLSSDKAACNGNTYMAKHIIYTGVSIPTDFTYPSFNVDIAFGYGGDHMIFLKTDQYCELVYHELSHASHFTKVGPSWWIQFGLDEKYNPGAGSYGACCQPRSGSIAVGESWAYHMGQYLANKKWGLQCTTFPEQGTKISTLENVIYFTSSGGKSSKEVFLENFFPQRPLDLDPNRWLAKGLFNDMMDDGVEPTSTFVIDNVSGFTNQKFYQALESNVNSMLDYKAKFLQQNNNLQQNEINVLFSQYGF
jgi:hypothetical protein